MTRNTTDPKYTVKHGLATLDKQMTRAQAQRHAERNMPPELKRAGFVTVLCLTTEDLHGGVWLRINYASQPVAPVAGRHTK